jgi:DNA-binding transcriptional LysR family regulator
MIDLKIFTFLKVAELRNYTRAAEALNLTQPAVSQHIQKLEAYYNCSLIKIKGKSIELTSQGHALYNYGHFQIANEIQLKDQINKVETPIKIGATLSVADYYLPEYLSQYLKFHREPFSVTVRNTKDILEMLLKNELYCAIIEGIFDKSIFNYYELVKTKFLPVARKGHPLEGIKTNIEAVHSYPLLLREEGSGTREIYENYLYQNNGSLMSASKVYEISSFGLIKKILSSSDSISFMYEGVALKEVENKDLCYLEIDNFNIERPLYFIYPENSLMKNKIETFYETLIEK